ncbi:MAG TPA: penicillin acylase family protein [Actinomycetota bacterium]|nr:penicillin acylase family protein [Actinomycetota bacterium]
MTDNPWATALRAAAEEAVPPVDGDLALPGLDGEVEVVRDRWGVPHIYATTLHDLFLAQGFVQASERLWQMEFLFRLGTGRLSELFSDLTVPMDRFIRTAGWNRAARRQADRWDERSVEMTKAFGDGIRAWLEVMPAPPVEYRVLDLEPAPLPDEDDAYLGAAAAVFMAWGLSRNWDHELLRAEVAERLGVDTMRMLFPDLDTEAGVVEAGKEGGFDRMALLRHAILAPGGQGSNNWVVDGARTRTGKPLLANDPHLAISVPSIWFEIHLTGPGIDVAGVALPFSPGVLIGHNDRIAWGFTNTEADVQDLYLERLNEDGTAAEYLGSWEPLTVHREEIRVRGRDEPEVVEVGETRHGPLLDSYTIGIAEPSVVQGGIRRSYALRWVGAEHGIQPSTVFNLNTAGSWEDFRAAVHDAWVCPGQNMVYADVDGNIGYQLTGLYPIRRQGDGTVPVPGWSDEYEWEGWIPFDDLPRAFNPEDGFVCTANNKMHDEGYPYLLGRDFLPPFRARRIAQMITERETHDRRSFAEMQVDTRLIPAADIVPHLVAVEPRDDRQKAAIALLSEWDHDVGADSAAAALYELWCHHLARRLLRPLLGEELFLHFYGRRQWTNAFQYQVLPNLLAYPTARWFGRNGAEARDEAIVEALDGALDELSSRLGDDPDGWRWGALHRARFAGRLAILGGLEELFTAGEVELGGDEQTVLQGKFEPEWSYDAVVIPSWRQILDPSDWDASVGTIPVGQSGHPTSAHFADLLPLWAAGEHHPMPFTRGAVDDAAESTLLLRPRAE